MKILVYVLCGVFVQALCWQDQKKYSPNRVSNKDDSSFRSNSITSRYNEEKMTFERLKKLAYKPYRPAPKLYYYYNPIEALRFEYQALVPQTNDFTPVRFNPALFRGYHGYGFNEWGGQGIV